LKSGNNEEVDEVTVPIVENTILSFLIPNNNRGQQRCCLVLKKRYSIEQNSSPKYAFSRLASSATAAGFPSSYFCLPFLPAFVETFTKSVASLRFHDVPDYDHFRNIFRASSLTLATSSDDEVILSFAMEKSPPVGCKRQRSKRLRLRQGGEQTPETKSAPVLMSSPENDDDYDIVLAEQEREISIESLKNPTPAMIEQLEKMKARASAAAGTFVGRRKLM